MKPMDIIFHIFVDRLDPEIGLIDSAEMNIVE